MKKDNIASYLVFKLMFTGTGVCILSSGFRIFPWYNPSDWMMVMLYVLAGEVLISLIIFFSDLSVKVLSRVTRVLMLMPAVVIVMNFSPTINNVNFSYISLNIYFWVGICSIGPIIKDVRYISSSID